MKTKHTPGPWIIMDEAHLDVPILRSVDLNGEGDYIGEVTIYEKADALLIAAAPDLLKAAHLALALIKDTWIEEHGNPQVGDVWKALADSIDKATK